MKFAVIDVGSNAVRLQITKVLNSPDEVTFKKLEYIRFPLRLGKDVFSTGKISEYNMQRFEKLILSFKNLIDLYEVDDYYGCATSAFRESKNGAKIIADIQKKHNIRIEIIDGELEASIMHKAINLYLSFENSVHIDVGGGSTEINIYHQNKKIASNSFLLGSVRNLLHNDTKKEWGEMTSWLQLQTEELKDIVAIGTGGNINKIFEIAKVKKQSNQKSMRIEEINNIYNSVKETSVIDRLVQFQMNPDRADVIIPATTIYTSIMKIVGAHTIVVPGIGLKDGVNMLLYYKHENKSASKRIIIKN